MKICIIDDNTSISGMFSKLLKMESHEVVVANGGRAGLELLDNDVFDAVIMDLAMPDFSGLDVFILSQTTHRSCLHCHAIGLV